MPRYVTRHGYGSKYGEGYLGPWESGIEVELSEEEAAWVNRDSPGCLAGVGAEQDVPPADAEEGEEQPPVEEEAEVADPVPDGTAQVVLEWVGSDADRAQRALTSELAKDLPRSTLIAALERIGAPQVDRQHRGGHNRGT